AALHATLVGGFANATGAQRDMQLRGELHELGLEADRAALARRNDALGVVEEPLVGDPFEVLRRAYERAEQARRRLLEHELGPHRPRVPEQQHEAVERAHTAL